MRLHITNRSAWFFLVGGAILPLILLIVPLYGEINEWISLGPDGGSVLSLAMDAGDHNVIYAGTRGSGAFKSTDGGVQWEPVNNGLPTDGSIELLMGDPVVPDTVYAFAEFHPYYSARLFKSSDGGKIWSAVETGFRSGSGGVNYTIVSMIFDAVDRKSIYASFYVSLVNPSGIMISRDGGANWEVRSTRDVFLTQLATDPNDSNIFYSGWTDGALNPTRGVVRSLDGGRTWSKLNLGLPDDARVNDLAVDPRRSNVLYVGLNRVRAQSILKSNNGGETWQFVGPDLSNSSGISSLAIDPTNPETLYAASGENGLFKSDNGGGSWRAVGSGLPEVLGFCKMTIDRADSRIMYISAGGLFRSLDAGVHWIRSDKGIVNSSISGLTVEPSNPSTIYAVSDTSLVKTTDRGKSWRKVLKSGYGLAIDIDPFNPNILYAPTERPPMKSTDAGDSWKLLDRGWPELFKSYAVVVDPVDSQIVYSLAYCDFKGCLASTGFKSIDGGNSWSQLENLQGTGRLSLRYLIVDPTNHNTLYAQNDAQVIKSEDGGVTWEKTGGFSPNDSSLLVLAIDPVDTRILYAGTNIGLYKTDDAAKTWRQLPQIRPPYLTDFSAIVVDPRNHHTLYLGTNSYYGGGVFRSTDGGMNWALINDGLPANPLISVLAVDPADSRTVYAGTYNAGLFRNTFITGVVLTSPNGAEAWGVGSSRNITWASGIDVQAVRLEYSTDAGLSYRSITESAPNTGSYDWTVPDRSSPLSLIRITDSPRQYSDVSDNLFSIVSCHNSISPFSQEFEAAGGNGNIEVLPSLSCDWTASSGVPWITVTSIANGTNNSIVFYTVAPNNTASSRTSTLTIAGQSFTVIQSGASASQSNNLFVPVVLAASGLNNSFFTSELTLTNRSSEDAQLHLAYQGSSGLGGGGGSADTVLSAGRQEVIGDTIAYLKSLGITIPDSGSRGGTLTISATGLTSSFDVAATVRTTTTAPGGRAGLAYRGIPQPTALIGSSYIFGLRQNEQDRSNVAFQNAGGASDGDITLAVTVYSNYAIYSKRLPAIVLSPGGFRQISGVLQADGLFLDEGYVRVERVRGNAPYYAYGVINDQANSDGSFIPALAESHSPVTGLILPAVVETGLFSSEIILTNQTAENKFLNLTYVAEAIKSSAHAFNFGMGLSPYQQMIIPDFVEYLRRYVGFGPLGPTYAGALFVSAGSGDLGGVLLAARTAASTKTGRYGISYTAVPSGASSIQSSWLYGLQQNEENRGNLALVNTGEVDASEDTFDIELFDGDTGSLNSTITGISLRASGWKQLNSILTDYAPAVRNGYAHVIRTAGNNPFIAYAVVNDGARPGERTGDGAFISSSP